MKPVLLATLILGAGTATLVAQPQFYNAVDGSALDFSLAMPEGQDTEAVREFMATGVNIYNEDPAVLDVAEDQYNTMCSGCHGHYAEGKIGPGLNDSFWSYEMGKTDVGLFSILYGGAAGQMGPMWGSLTLDEMLLTMAWVRHLYTGDPAKASWLTPEQREAFTPFTPGGSDAGAADDPA